MNTRQRLFNIILSLYVIFGICNPSFSEGFRKYPYLQNVKPNEMTICWEIESTGDTTDLDNYRVEYGIGAYSDVASYPDAYPTDPRLFQLTLTGLHPGTLYQYRVKSGSVEDGATFLTAVEGSQPFSFAVYGDTRSQDDVPNRNHEEVVDLINSWSPNFVISTGDLWFSNGDEYSGGGVQEFFEVEKDLIKNTPLFPTLGNHEYYTSFSPGAGTYTEPESYKKYFVLPTNLSSTEDYYSFDYGNSHFLVVNTNRDESLEVGGSDYRVGSTQHTAIERDLINASNSPDIVHIFVAMHKPAHSNGWKHGCGIGVIEDPVISVDLGELFQTYDVDIVFSSHEHNYERFQPADSNHQQIWIGEPPGDPTDPDHPCNTIDEGVTYVVTGGGGASLSYVDPSGTTEDCPSSDPDCNLPTPALTSIIAESTYHAMFITVNGEKVNVEVKRTDGSVLDRFTVDKERR